MNETVDDNCKWIVLVFKHPAFLHTVTLIYPRVILKEYVSVKYTEAKTQYTKTG